MELLERLRVLTSILTLSIRDYEILDQKFQHKVVLVRLKLPFQPKMNRFRINQRFLKIRKFHIGQEMIRKLFCPL